MPPKHDDLLDSLNQLGEEEQQQQAQEQKQQKRKEEQEQQKQQQGDSPEDPDDPFGDISKQLSARPAHGTSRPTTPCTATSATTITGDKGITPEGSSGEGSRASGEGATRSDTGKGKESTPKATPPAEKQPPPAPSGGGWWGSLYSTATAAVKQAETLAKDLSANEEATKWASTARANLAGLQAMGTDLRERALPTFTALVAHLAPPISAHERLQIHLAHDLRGYPALDPVVYGVFAGVMAQVEGGDLLVVQRGSEARARSNSGAAKPAGYSGGVLGSGGGGWADGPWWRDDARGGRSLEAVAGLREGTRLARVGAEAYAREFFEARGGVEEAAKRAAESMGDENPTRCSDIFLSVQAVVHERDPALFAADAREEKDGGGKDGEGEKDDEDDGKMVSFALYLHDPLHSLAFSTLSQPLPYRWARWLDASNTPSAPSSDAESDKLLPPSIRALLDAGGVDPREWVAEWMERSLCLATGVVAQGYVAKRMGVGESGGEGGMEAGKKGGGQGAGEEARVL